MSRWYGSVTNRIEEGMVGRPEPQVGMGGYLSYWSDCEPYYIKAIERSGTGRIRALYLVEAGCRHIGGPYENKWQIETWDQCKDKPVSMVVYRTRSKTPEYTTDGTKDGTAFLHGHVYKYYDYEF